MKTHFRFTAANDRVRQTVGRGLVQAVLVGALIWGAATSRAAEGPLVAVQETLKQQQFFHGETNGILDEPTSAALRRFQIRHGLPVTGELDNATMQALQNPPVKNSAPTVAAAPIPNEPPEFPDVVAKDRAFLQALSASSHAVTAPNPTSIPTETVATPPPTPVTGRPLIVRTEQLAPPPPPPPPPPTVVSVPLKKKSPKVRPERTGNRAVERTNATTPVVDREIASTPNRYLPRRAEWNEAEEPVPPPRRRTFVPTQAVVVDTDLDVREARRSQVTRTTTTRTGADGRTSTTVTFSNSPGPRIVRVEPPPPPSQRQSLLQRIFNDDDDDDDD